jgi:hypothetical protein
LHAPRARLTARILDVELLHCRRCGGGKQLIAFITERAVIVHILDHLGELERAPRMATIGGIHGDGNLTRQQDLWTGRSRYPDLPVDVMPDFENQNQDLVRQTRTPDALLFEHASMRAPACETSQALGDIWVEPTHGGAFDRWDQSAVALKDRALCLHTGNRPCLICRVLTPIRSPCCPATVTRSRPLLAVKHECSASHFGRPCWAWLGRRLRSWL